MAPLDAKTSNELFEALANWETHLRAHRQSNPDDGATWLKTQ